MLAAVRAIKTLRHYLLGRRCELVTNHQPLLHLMSKKEPTGQYARRALSMQDYEFTVTHRPGVKHQNADHLYRYPRESSEDPSVARLDDEEEEEEGHDVTTGPSGVLATAPCLLLSPPSKQPWVVQLLL